MIDVEQLRAEARERARNRTPVPFRGSIEDSAHGRLPVRTYSPDVRVGLGTVFFAHGGYGLFGDLDLQDGYCRLVSEVLEQRVISVDYRLAPEHSFEQSCSDLLDAIRADKGHDGALLCGDSAGGAICAAVADRLGAATRGLLLTNPNLDLSLSSFDRAAPEGPDEALSRFALERWCPGPASERMRLDQPTTSRPPTFLAVGTRDALLPEARHLQHSSSSEAGSFELLEAEGAGHGFMSDPLTARAVLRRARVFFDGASGTKRPEPGSSRRLGSLRRAGGA